MSKSKKQEQAHDEQVAEQIEAEAPKAEESIRFTPVLDVILDYVLGKVKDPATQEKLRVQSLKIVAEQDGFVRNGNRQDYNRDAEAFTSAKIEHTAEGMVFNYSTMKTRRLSDIAFTAIVDGLAPAIYPPIPQKNGKINSQKAKREGFAEQLGFSKPVVVGGKGFTRRLFEVEGSAELLAKIGELIPERFEGSKAPEKPNKRTVQFNLPASLLGAKVSRNLYDPTVVGPDTYGQDLTWVTVALSQDWAFADRDNEISKAYENLILAAREQEKKDAEKQQQQPAA